jgi:hypothetical protein
MNPETIITVVGGVVSLINAVLPLIPKSSAGSPAIGKVISSLTTLAPLITDQISVLYTGIKNTIASVGSHPAATADQRAALAAFDKQVDDAWNAIEGQLDPDAPGASA